MRIVSLQAENIKRLKAVEITPEGNMVKITGRNGAGKTSVLDAIWWGLGGGDSIQGKPIRDGQETAHITLNLGDIIVERRFTQKGTQLVVRNPDGAKFSSPQKMLDDLVGRLTFDPLQFMRMEPRKQAETLKDLAGLDFSELDEARQNAYEERTAVNRQVKELEAQVAGISVPEDAPTEEVDVSALAHKLQEAHEINNDIDAYHNYLADRRKRADDLQAEISDLQQRLNEATATLAHVEDEISETEKSPPGERIDTQEIAHQMNSAQATNAAVAKRRQRDDLQKKLEDRRRMAQDLTSEISNVDTAKAEQIQAAKLPVEGLGFDEEGGITFNGVPLQQASGAEQLRVSAAMAMALNPKLRVLRIADASLLDSESLALIEQMANDNDYQVWLECVDESGHVGIVIEDGEVRRQDDEYPFVPGAAEETA